MFYTQRDRQVYLKLLADQTRLAHVRVLAYRLMTNHIHLIAVPEEADSLALCLQRVHGRYAQYVNTRQRSGHLWQNRFYSCPLDERHLRMALGYVERNPVVGRAEVHAWSSAPAHLSGSDPLGLLDLTFWRAAGGAEQWRQLIEYEEDDTERRRLRRATFAGDPLGSEEFVERWKPKAGLQTLCA